MLVYEDVTVVVILMNFIVQCT